MSLFQFELRKVEDIEPWGSEENPSLSWFALTDGTFRINVGDQTLLEYTPEILAHWNCSATAAWSQSPLDAEYQIAAFGRDILRSVAHAVSPLSESVECWVRNWPLLETLDERSQSLLQPGLKSDRRCYSAWRWLGERTPWLSYLQATPRVSYVRVGDLVEIHWNNSKLEIDGIDVWTASKGRYVLPVEDFVRECQSFSDRLLLAMKVRLTEIETAECLPQASVNIASLWEEHESWRNEFEKYLSDEAVPEISWPETEAALQSLATQFGVVLP